MTKEIYPWKRFWCPREGKLNLQDGGYLTDPTDDYGVYLNPDLKSYADISATPCLVLLGEPGIGKSFAMSNVATAVETGNRVIRIDLREFGSEDRFVRALFGCTDLQEWLLDYSRLEIYLDSLDEGLMRIETIVPILQRHLRSVPHDRLLLRIACRTAEWPSSLESSLRSYWVDSEVGVFELTPLRRDDVEYAAGIEGLDPKVFIEEIGRVRAQPLAIKPVTLDFLIRTCKKCGGLPPSEAELYNKGCTILCDESEERRDTRSTGQYDTDQKVAVAKKIAATMLLGNRFAVWTGPRHGCPDEDIMIHALAKGTERANGKDFEVAQASVEETLNTGLFTSRGVHRLGWAHQTYAEFLAAEYLIEHKVGAAKLFKVFTSGSGKDRAVVPQLSEIAARIANQNQELFDLLLDADPGVLLRSDVATAGDVNRQKLVAAIIGVCQRDGLHFPYREYGERLRHLAYPGLLDEIKRVLKDPGANQEAKQLAVEISEACSIQGAGEELLAIALSPDSNIHLRVYAVMAIGSAGEQEYIEQLTPLVVDPEDSVTTRLKGVCMRLLWPKYISAEDLFGAIELPRPDNEINAYSTFIAHELVDRLPPEQIPVALDWALSQEKRRFDLDHIFADLIDGIIGKAWAHKNEHGILPRLASVVLYRLGIDYGRIMGEENEKYDFLKDKEGRHELLLEVLKQATNDQMKHLSMFVLHSSLVRREDLNWVLDQLTTAPTDPAVIELWGILAKRSHDVHDVLSTSTIISRSFNEERIREAFSWLFEVVELGSSRATQLRDEYQQFQPLDRTHEDDSELDPPLEERIPHFLDLCERERPEIWWHISRELTLEPERNHYGDEFRVDVTDSYGWRNSSPEIQGRIVQAAKRFLLETSDDRDNWMKDAGRIHLLPAAGYQALRLLYDHEPSFIQEISQEIWIKWLGALCYYPLNLGKEEIKSHYKALLRQAYSLVPNDVLTVFEQIIRRETANGGLLQRLKRTAIIFDGQTAQMLQGLSQDMSIGRLPSAQIQAFLIENGYAQAVAAAFKIARRGLPNEQAGKEAQGAVVAVVSELGGIVDEATWPELMKAFECDPALGERVIYRWAGIDRHGESSPLSKLSDAQLADFYVWVCQHFPSAEDPQTRGVHTVTERESVAHWRDQTLLSTMTGRATISMLKELRRINMAIPEVGLGYTIRELGSQIRLASWDALSPEELSRLIEMANTTVVNNCEDLLNLVIDSLVRLEKELHGPTPAVRELWDRHKDKWQPVEENAMSDNIVRHLRRDLVGKRLAINREVQIRTRLGKEPAQEPDILVEALRNGEELVAVPIECKGCWHDEVLTAMETQLRDRYVIQNGLACGLYLVGWFLCDDWDKYDHRRGKTPQMSIAEARDKFEAQAKGLSRDGILIKACALDTHLSYKES